MTNRKVPPSAIDDPLPAGVAEARSPFQGLLEPLSSHFCCAGQVPMAERGTFLSPSPLGSAQRQDREKPAGSPVGASRGLNSKTIFQKSNNPILFVHAGTLAGHVTSVKVLVLIRY